MRKKKEEEKRAQRMPANRLYAEIVEAYLETGSVQQTAKKLGTTSVTVRKVLITENLWSSRTSREVRRYLDLGKTTAEIAQILSTTEKAVQQYLPYTKGMYHSDDPSVSAQNSADYRRRVQNAKERAIRRAEPVLIQKGWSNVGDLISFEDIRAQLERGERARDDEQYPGSLCLRDLPDFDASQSKCREDDILRLHLELVRADGEGPAGDAGSLNREREETVRVLRAYGGVSGETISRDIAVPSSLSLYALHYVIQRLFGWQNSHLHHFSLPEERFEKVTGGKAGSWGELVGVLFQSPYMADEDRFWNDDYEGGSFKVWLRKKYRGPYVSLNHGEGIVQSRADMAEIRWRAPYVELLFTELPNGKESLRGAVPAENLATGARRKKSSGTGDARKQRVAFDDAPVGAIRWLFEAEPNQLLERLSIEQVLAFRDRSIADGLAACEEIAETFEDVLNEDVVDEILDILESELDEPEVQPFVDPTTDTLYYFYDYGDGWAVKITGSYGCADLVEAGRLTQEEIDEAIRTVYTKFCPVCLCADGLPVLDDVGGIDGYVRFLRGINRKAEREYWASVAAETGKRAADLIPENWAYDDPDALEWAKGLGWSKRKIRPENML